MIKIDKLKVSFNGNPVGELSLDVTNKVCIFEYDNGWLLEGFSVSPLELPLRPSVFTAKPLPFNGGFGVFEDSLPDGYGRYLLHKSLLRLGVDDAKLSVIDRLSIVGDNTMGGLSYHPATRIIDEEECTDFDVLQQKALEVLKEQQDKDAPTLLYNSGNSGGARPKAVFSDIDGHWLIKFRHFYDSKDIGIKEFHYNEIARACGINVPDFKLTNNRYFTTRRFDMASDGTRLHTATAGGILGVSHKTPILDYDNLLALTGFLTQNSEDVKEMFRRMVFNYITDNKDDHSKNFSFYVVKSPDGKWKWRLAPAYDLTPFPEGYNGEHATSVNGTGKPTLSDFMTSGEKIGLSKKVCNEIIDQVIVNASDLYLHKLK